MRKKLSADLKSLVSDCMEVIRSKELNNEEKVILLSMILSEHTERKEVVDPYEGQAHLGYTIEQFNAHLCDLDEKGWIIVQWQH